MKMIKKLMILFCTTALVLSCLPVYADDLAGNDESAAAVSDYSANDAETAGQPGEATLNNEDQTESVSAIEEQTESESANEERTESGFDNEQWTEPASEKEAEADSEDSFTDDPEVVENAGESSQTDLPDVHTAETEPDTAAEPVSEVKEDSKELSSPGEELCTHNWVLSEEESAAASYNAEGKNVYHCSLCGETKEETIPAVGRVDVSTLKASLEYETAVYDGSLKTPAVTLTDGNYKLVQDKDYKAAYSKNRNAGTASVIIKGLEKYKGQFTLTFTIKKAAQTPTVSLAKNRIAVKKAVKIKAKGKGEATYTSSDKAIAGVDTDGTVTAKTPGTVKITVKFSGDANYKAKSKSVKLTVIPAKTKITSIENTAKGLRLTWKKSPGATRYYIYRSVKGHRYTLLKTIKNAALKATDSTVLSGKKYYYKVVPYGGKQKGDASAVKSYFRLDRPEIKSVTNPEAGTVKVSWTRVKKAEGYAVISIIDGVQKIYWIRDPYTTSKTIRGVKDEALCKFYIRAYKDNEGKKSWSQKSLMKKITARENYVKVTGSGSTRTIELVNPKTSVQSARAAVWSATGEQDDLVWYTMSQNSAGNWTAEASASVIAHSGTCNVHIYEDHTFLGAGTFTLTSEEQKTAVNPKVRQYARNLLNQVGWTLRDAYNWSIKLPYQSMVIPMTVPTKGEYAGFNRQELYFVYAYEYGKGNCFCCAASFYWMARELGYEARLIEGRVREGAHGWVEIDIDGVTYLFDPETEGSLGYDVYMKTYETAPPMDYVKERPY